MRRTKIVATIGPATDCTTCLEALISAGLDVARINASHAGVDELRARLEAVRRAARNAGRHVAVMLDLAGPKVRVGNVAPGVELVRGSTFTLVGEDCEGDATRACVTYRSLAADVRPGDRILIDDGKIELSVDSVDGWSVHTRVISGGVLTSRKGVNVPGVTLGVDPVTSYDREVLAWGLEAGVDYVAQSFVRSASDVAKLREIMGTSEVPIVAKIEKHEATAHLDEIVQTADVVMVARGDLGVETSPEQVPVLQRQIIRSCREQGTPVIVATQMLESMVAAPRPTRAEASDVAHAIFARADAVMLSAETAIGQYPIESLATMARIALTAEASMDPASRRRLTAPAANVTQAVSAAVRELAEDLGVRAIVTATQSGATARAVARHRPSMPIVAVTPYHHVARRLALVWGVIPIVMPLAEQTDEMLLAVDGAIVQAGLARPGDRIAVTAGIASRAPGATDFVVVREVGLRA